ncbi:MAG: pseudouridine synthase, RluA family, ribosomal large subunit pseudouridine synthase D [Microgenomates group bacterium GW2011_GWC1_39_7]|nr:MAG: pseudouridine synthase, RluA family, ribosomal large subunit pseudouridine synthase D [Microgenomates group bacterium GW2011_GWC1_39_7]
MVSPKIIYQDESIAVVDKPAGMIVNRADTAKNQVTLQEWAEKKFQISNLKFKISDTLSPSDNFINRAGIVHRLDKETSGILIIAKNEESFVNLQKQFKEGRVKKTYFAVCHGEIKPSEGEINIPIGRLPWNRMRFGVLPQGKEAKSKYKVLSIKYKVWDKVSEPLSLVKVYPETGRTHQIRVHMQYIGHPIFADELYAGRKTSKRDREILPRHFLHAAKISFLHPKTGKRIEFESPFPKELSEFLTKLQ